MYVDRRMMVRRLSWFRPIVGGWERVGTRRSSTGAMSRPVSVEYGVSKNDYNLFLARKKATEAFPATERVCPVQA